MSILDLDDLVERVQISLGTSASLFQEAELEFCCEQAVLELGTSFPIEKSALQLWIIERAKRHSLDILRIQSAHRFKYKQLSLNDRFNHYNALIQDMDAKFENALNTDPDLLNIPFSGVMGFYIRNGFVYDKFGNSMEHMFANKD